jgi:hypothetical protein
LSNKDNFSFELSWLKHEGFNELVVREWQSVPNVDNPMLNWQNKKSPFQALFAWLGERYLWEI